MRGGREEVKEEVGVCSVCSLVLGTAVVADICDMYYSIYITCDLFNL